MTIKCPRTGDVMKVVDVDGIKVDVSEKCGALWFDNYELKKVDESHEKAGDKLQSIIKKYESSIDKLPRIKCPKCENTVMMRHYYSPHKTFQIDTCPSCAGVWLDPGELAQLRALFKDDVAREKFSEEFSSGVAIEIRGKDPSLGKKEKMDLIEKLRLFL